MFERFHDFKENVRPDGRELLEVRPAILNVGTITTADASALVKFGNTTVVCGIKAELTTPKDEKPDVGFIVPNVDLPPLCSGRFKPGPPTEQAQAASKFMDNVLVNSKCVSLEELCIKKGKLAWVLYCDMMCLDYDGNILDACVLAMVAALKTMTLPKVTLEDDDADPKVDLKTKEPLKLHNLPVASTYAIFDDSIIFSDPTSEEELLATGAITIVTLDEERIGFVHKPGGSKMNDSKLMECFKLAKKQRQDVERSVLETTESILTSAS